MTDTGDLPVNVSVGFHILWTTRKKNGSMFVKWEKIEIMEGKLLGNYITNKTHHSYIIGEEFLPLIRMHPDVNVSFT